MLASAKVYGAIRDGSGFFQHGHTYMGHATACAAALAVQKAIKERNLLDNVKRRGARLEEMLTERLGNHRHVGDIRGRGLFLGVELVHDRTSKEPFDKSFGLAGRIKAEAMKRAMICYPMSGTIDGQNGDHVLLAPPFIVEEKHLVDITDRLAGAIDAAIESVAS
jgi:adenosylmethionine-8-amino-7-oxononanoate aminotransferase